MENKENTSNLSDKIVELLDEWNWKGYYVPKSIKTKLKKDLLNLNKESIKRLKVQVKSKLIKLGVRIKEDDKFDLIGVNNAIWTIIGEIDKEFGDKLT